MKIKSDYDEMIEENKREQKRRQEHLKAEYVDKENDLLSKLNSAESELHQQAYPRIQELEKQQNEMLADLQNLSNDVETLKSENERLVKQLHDETER